MQNKEVATILASLGKSLKGADWFKKSKWIVSTHEFPANKPEAMTLHAYKSGWFNDDKMGIHVETFLSYDKKKRKKSYVALHLCHHPIIPNTKLKRIVISKPIVDSIFEEVASWPGYQFRAGKYGLQPFTCVVDGLDPNFEKVVAGEFSRICRYVGPRIDQALKAIL